MMVRSPEKAGSLSIGRIVIPKEEQSTGKEQKQENKWDKGERVPTLGQRRLPDLPEPLVQTRV